MTIHCGRFAASRTGRSSGSCPTPERCMSISVSRRFRPISPLELHDRLAAGLSPVTLVHPTAVIADSALIGEGGGDA